ncbi:Zinc/iron permease [Amylocarpus encephaloides]|uniref:Zinc/iron permease n=1 Tax=Amylocarpus encephaloides TaxID=45428 RepID=A0A9P7YPL3_9HELO|nr:Zinc/iron permease [Amylocarpus encephaloides]
MRQIAKSPVLAVFKMADFDPSNVNLDTTSPVDIICYLSKSSNDYNGQLGARLSAIFVILVTSGLATFFPVLASRVERLRINLYVYYFARYFGAGVIIATAFIHLLDPAYAEIGPQTCVGMTGAWADYAWCPAIVMISIMLVFLMDFGAERWVEHRYGFLHPHPNIEAVVTSRSRPNGTHDQVPAGDQDMTLQKVGNGATNRQAWTDNDEKDPENVSLAPSTERMQDRLFQQQIAAFLVLEFGVVFHSVIIGLNLGTTGEEFKTLYPVLVFHQAFEGLGIGARMSAIPFPKGVHWLPWALCLSYTLTTPIAIAVGLGLRTTYNAGSFTASVVSGVLDATSAGILIYTGLVELLARDFLFNSEPTRDSKRLTFMVACVFLGVAIMALLGKWA